MHSQLLIPLPQSLSLPVIPCRPELDSEWTSLKDPVNGSSVVVRGLDPDTQYHFAVQAVNVYGASPHSVIADPIWTFSECGEASLH